MRFTPSVLVPVLLLLPRLAGAQVFTVGGGDDRESLGPRRSPVLAGGSLIYGRPTGDFADYVKQGFGVDGFARWKVDRRGAFSIGVEGGWMQYGRETIPTPLSSTVGRINVDVTTSNNIVFLGLGPQLMVPSGPVRPYVNGAGGLRPVVHNQLVQLPLEPTPGARKRAPGFAVGRLRCGRQPR